MLLRFKAGKPAIKTAKTGDRREGILESWFRIEPEDLSGNGE